MKKFWNWIHNDSGGRVLRLEGPIDEESFWGDSVTPQMFREELESDTGDITVWINSPGGNVFAAAEIYTMLRDYKGTVTVKIDAIAASAASVIAMAGSKVLMSPVAMLMIHDPSTIAMGNAADMQKAIDTLNEVKESIINAYQAKSGLSHSRISNLMSNESWLNAKKCVELGFADAILFENEDTEEEEEDEPETEEDGEEQEEEAKGIHLKAHIYSSRQMGLTILNRLGVKDKPGKASTDSLKQEKPVNNEPSEPVIGMDGKTKDGSMPFELLMKQLECMR